MMWFCSLIQYLLMLIQRSEPGTDWTEEFEHLNWKERIWAMWLHRLLQNRLRLWNLTPKILSRGSNNYYSHFHLTIRENKLCIIRSTGVWCIYKKKRMNVQVMNLQRKSMINRPSHNRPVGLWKNVRPFGGPITNPSPAESPPVSELESPKIKMTGVSAHWDTTFWVEWRKHNIKFERCRMRREHPLSVIFSIYYGITICIYNCRVDDKDKGETLELSKFHLWE